MSELTLAQRFGSNVNYDPIAKNLTINLKDLADSSASRGEGGDFTNGYGLDTEGMTDANKDEYSAKILWALVALSAQNQPETNNDETVGVFISNEGKRNAVRNGVAQFGYRQVVTGYINDNLGNDLDPDAIV